MNALLSAFGIDWRLLVINMVNFGLLLLALWYFLYTPLTRMLEERRMKVAQGVADAEESAARLAEIESSKAEKLAAAGREADAVLSNARKSAIEKGREMLSESEAAAQRLIKNAEIEAKEAKARSVEESKQEVAKLIVLGIEKTAAQS